MRCSSLALLAVIAIACCSCAAQGDYSDISDYTETPTEFHIHAAGRAGEIRQKDRYFVFRAGVGSLYDVTMAEIALEKSGNPAVQDYARRVLADAGERGRRIAVIAQQHLGIAAPDLLDRTLAARRDQLAALGDGAFDDAWLHDRIERSKEEIAVYDGEARGGSEPFLTEFAGDALPQLEHEQRIASGLVATVSR